MAGGLVAGNLFTSSTEIIDLDTREVRLAGDMATPRARFGMFRVGFAGKEILLTFGSAQTYNVTTDDSVYIGTPSDEDSLLQQWNPVDETWVASPAVLASKFEFVAISVDASLICKPGTFFYTAKL